MESAYGLIDWSVIQHSDGDGIGRDKNPLPLYVVANIFSFLESPADISRACRTCRTLYYMCLPQLYTNVTLRSYNHIRYAAGTHRPEGVGGASPFTMGLNTIVTRDVGMYIKKFEVRGEWRDYDLESFARAGRVPEGSMMLNMLVRAAIDRMPILEEFNWHLDTKMLPIVWQGLAIKQSVTSITCRFPEARAPRPVITLPSIPNLKYLHITDIDPLCYPDDVSELLVGSKKLEHLKLHWSPRMREEKEPSVSIHAYFGKILQAQYRMPLKSLALQNLYAQYDKLIQQMTDPRIVESFTFISTVGGNADDPSTAFIDYSWRTQPPQLGPLVKLNKLRGDKVNGHLVAAIAKVRCLRYYYLLSGRELRERPSSNFELNSVGGTPNPSISAHTPSSNPHSHSGMTPRSPTSPHSPPPPHRSHSNLEPYTSHTPISHYSNTHSAYPGSPIAPPELIDELGRAYLEIIFRNHGPTLLHLLLRPEWRLSAPDIQTLAHSCPNLSQVGIGVDHNSDSIIRVCLRFLHRLEVIRILDPPDGDDVTASVLSLGDAWHEDAILAEIDALGTGVSQLKWFGLGECVFEVQTKMVENTTAGSGSGGGGGGSGKRKGSGGSWRRERVVRRVPLEKVHDVEMWSMDRKEI